MASLEPGSEHAKGKDKGAADAWKTGLKRKKKKKVKKTGFAWVDAGCGNRFCGRLGFRKDQEQNEGNIC
ncbi:hypothetical protein HPP92_009806 [Vanilla planifolia]|uniref:Uncharacterized protein n=1 Tax=Vanilla planifolia TaxID=51239 RepID=A0A835RGW9_VANPL|nr:hypothetical protein HPP92_009806 [Vanilla planifolia]